MFFFQAEDGIRDVRTGLEFRRVLFRSLLMGLVGVAIVLGMGLMTETTNYEVSACM